MEIFDIVALIFSFVIAIGGFYLFNCSEKNENEYRKSVLDYLDRILKKMR